MKLNPAEVTKNYLFVAETNEDAALLDRYGAQEERDYTKVGEKTYFGCFSEHCDTIHAQLKEKLNLTGKLYWIDLPYFTITKG